jgi:hypothetical protein
MRKYILLAGFSMILAYTHATSPIVAPGCTLQIGDTYAGGIVFYIDTGADCHGLVCAPAEQAKEIDWSDADSLCKAITIANYSDWRLPKLNELNMMYQHLFKAGMGSFVGAFYWSATVYHAYYAWDQNFANGKQYCSGKGTTAYVRAVRAF